MEGNPKLMLLVEDVEDNRGVVRQLAARMKVRLLEAADGKTGVELARSHGPDLILMDLSLPVLDGWEAMRQLKGDPASAAIPIVALTAHAMVGDEARARKSGADAYVAKPFDIRRLRALLQDLLEGHRP